MAREWRGRLMDTNYAVLSGVSSPPFFPNLSTHIHWTCLRENTAGASCLCVFHQSTALITTTSIRYAFLADSFCESSYVCENHLITLQNTQSRKSSGCRISTTSGPPTRFILGKKASTVRQRVISAGESYMTGTGTAREESQSMEFSVTKSALLNELTTTQGVVERKTTPPILSNLLVEAKGARAKIPATDLELSVRTSCEAKVKKEGAGTIPAKKLLELVRLLPEGEIKFKLLDNHWVEIISEQKKYKIGGMSKEDLPALPAMPHQLL